MALLSKEYWARKQGADLVAEVRKKVKRHFDAADGLGLIAQWREHYSRYYMQNGKNIRSGTQLDLGTRKRPEVNINVPEMRSLLRQQLAFLLAEPISFQCISNTGAQRSVMGSEVGEKAVNY